MSAPIPSSSTAGVSSSTSDEFFSLLNKLLVAFIAKDAYGFFHEPVDTSLVTDYLTVIKQPMDFSTMNKKVANKQYKGLREFQSDFELICSNCMTYNAPNTIYYKSGQKLLHYGRKLIAKEAQKANALLILAAAEDATNMGLNSEDLGDLSQASVNQLKRKAEIALYKKLHDGSTLFTSLKRYRGPVNIPTNPDGSLDLKEYPDVEQLLVRPLTPSMTEKNSIYSTLGCSSNIIASYLTQSQLSKIPAAASGANAASVASSTSQSTNLMTPYALNLCDRMPYYSFSPFYDSQGFGIANFESPGLSLAYGDPKGRAYVDSLESFLNKSVHPGKTSEYLRDFCERMVDNLTCGGHSYVKGVEAWRENVLASNKNPGILHASSSPSSVSASSSLSDLPSGSVLLPGETSAAKTSSNLKEQIKHDLNLLARILRWKKYEPDMDRLDKVPPIQLIRQFHFQSSNISNQTPSNEPSAVNPLPIDQKLSRISSLLLNLQAMQNDRFKLGNPVTITTEERHLVSEVKTLLVALAGLCVPQDLSPSQSAARNVMMNQLKEDRPVPLYKGTLPENRAFSVTFPPASSTTKPSNPIQ